MPNPNQDETVTPGNLLEHCSSCGQPQFPKWVDLDSLRANLPESYEEWMKSQCQNEQALVEMLSELGIDHPYMP